MPSETVRLSVVVVSAYSHALLRRCLDGILANEGGNEVEILVADRCTDEPISNLIEKYRNVRFLQFAPKAGLPLLAGAGIQQAKGEIVAVTDASCVVAPGWISAILKAHRSPTPVIGGAVEVREKMKPLDWAAYFCEYGQFMPPLSKGVVDVLPGNNITFKRSVLEKGTEYVEPEFWKTYWCEKLKEDGIELIIEPTILTYYGKVFQMVPFFARRFHHGRCFAGMRTNRSSLVIRLVYSCGTVVLPFVFLYRTMTAVLARKRFLKEFVISFPFVLLAIASWSLGETCGYLGGKGKSCEYIY